MNRLQAHFKASYDKWKTAAKQAKRALDEPVSVGLHDHIVRIKNTSEGVKQAYEDLRSYETPDGDTRCRVDTCDTVSQKIIQEAQENLTAEEDDKDLHRRSLHWSEAGSVFISAASQRSKHSSNRHSGRSSKLSVKRQEAAAEVAAAEATLKVMEEMEQKWSKRKGSLNT